MNSELTREWRKWHNIIVYETGRPPHRKIKNNRLAAAGYNWAFSALTASPGARAHYDRRRDTGDRHAAAQRNLFGRLLGCLHHCLLTGQHYDEATAFPAATKKISQAA